MEIMDPRLNFFETAPIQLAIEKSTYQDYTPITALADQQPIHFLITGSPKQCWDLKSSYLMVKAKITKADGSAPLTAAEVSVVNNTFYSLFQEVQATLNDKPITESNSMFPLRKYIEFITTFENDAQRWVAPSVNFVKDVAGKMDVTKKSHTNTALATRAVMFDAGKPAEMLGRLPLDLANQDVVIPPNCKLEFKLIPSKDNFMIKKDPADNEVYKIKILEVRLYLACLELADSNLIALNKMLETDNARWFITRVEMKSITIASGHQSVQRDNVFSGKLPKRLTMVFVSEAALAGSYILNPFNFQHFTLNHLALNVNGEMVPSVPFTPDFAGGNYIRDYMLGMQDGLHKVFSDHAANISYEEFAKGYTIYVFDLTPNKSVDMCPQLTGNIRVEAKFGTALAATVQMIFYAEYDDVIELSKTELITPY